MPLPFNSFHKSFRLTGGVTDHFAEREWGPLQGLLPIIGCCWEFSDCYQVIH